MRRPPRRSTWGARWRELGPEAQLGALLIAFAALGLALGYLLQATSR